MRELPSPLISQPSLAENPMVLSLNLIDSIAPVSLPNPPGVSSHVNARRNSATGNYASGATANTVKPSG